jgi:hypothetical protein
VLCLFFIRTTSSFWRNDKFPVCPFQETWLSSIRYSLFSDSPLYPELFTFLHGSEILGLLVSTDICIATSKCVFILFYCRSYEYLPTDVHIKSVSDFMTSVLHCVWRSNPQEKQKNVALFSSLHLRRKRLTSAIASVNGQNTNRNIVESLMPQVKCVAGKLPPYTVLLSMCSRQVASLHCAVANALSWRTAIRASKLTHNFSYLPCHIIWFWDFKISCLYAEFWNS